MREANVIRQPTVEQEEVAVVQPKQTARGYLAGLVGLVTRGSKSDFTQEDWQRLEFRRGPAPCPLRDVANQYQWRI